MLVRLWNSILETLSLEDRTISLEEYLNQQELHTVADVEFYIKQYDRMKHRK